ncbi:hypothetical protein D3C78_1877680 [compost metagenome]
MSALHVLHAIAFAGFHACRLIDHVENPCKCSWQMSAFAVLVGGGPCTSLDAARASNAPDSQADYRQREDQQGPGRFDCI